MTSCRGLQRDSKSTIVHSDYVGMWQTNRVPVMAQTNRAPVMGQTNRVTVMG